MMYFRITLYDFTYFRKTVWRDYNKLTARKTCSCIAGTGTFKFKFLKPICFPV